MPGTTDDAAGDPRFRVRFRFRTAKSLNLAGTEHRLNFSGRHVTLSDQNPDHDLRDARWLVMRAGGFTSEAEAQVFGQKLKWATAVSSLGARLGVDVGDDRASLSFSDQLVDEIRRKQGAILRPNVHGVDVFPDSDAVCVMAMSASGVVRAQPEPFLSQIASFMDVLGGTSPKTGDAILLLNAALMSTEPMARIVLAVAAIEMMGEDQEWSSGQRALLQQLAASADCHEGIADEERREVGDAIRRGLHRISVRQGILRVLADLGLSGLKREWDDLYTQRSAAFHGLQRMTHAECAQLADRAAELCGRIVLAAVAREFPP